MTTVAATTPESRCAALGLDLSHPVPPIGSYRAVTVHGGLAMTSGVVALAHPDWTLLHPGRLGADLSPEDAAASACGAMLCTLANLRDALGTLDAVVAPLRVVGYVQTEREVVGLPKVLDGATELLRDIFGDAGLPARSAIGVHALPGGASVELECTFAVRS